MGGEVDSAAPGIRPLKYPWNCVAFSSRLIINMDIEVPQDDQFVIMIWFNQLVTNPFGENHL